MEEVAVKLSELKHLTHEVPPPPPLSPLPPPLALLRSSRLPLMGALVRLEAGRGRDARVRVETWGVCARGSVLS
eukprot:1233627-Rhodomonas_salina.1